MAEHTPRDILADAIVTGPNVLPLDPSAAPAIPAEPMAEEGESTSETPGDVTPETPAPAEPADGEQEPEDEGETDESPAQQARKKRGGVQQRFSELSHQRDLARQEADYWKQRALQEGTPDPAPQAQGHPRQPDGRPIRPDETQFEQHADYIRALGFYEDALVDWNVSRALTQERMRRDEEAALQRIRDAHDDYDEVVRNANVVLPNDVSAAVLASQEKHRLIYYLATHTEEAGDLREVHGPAAYLAIGRLEARLAAAATGPSPPATESPPPRISQAPAPITPTNGVGAPATRSYDDMSLEEFFAARNKEESRRRR